MTTPRIIALTALALVIVAATVGAILIARVDVQGRFESAASEITGLDVRVEGTVSTRILPTLRVTLENVRARDGKREIASIGRVESGIEYLPLLHRRAVLSRLHLEDVKLALERDINGKLDVRLHPRERGNESTHVKHLSFAGVDLVYTNRKADKFFIATDCRSDALDLRLERSADHKWTEHFAIDGHAQCAEMRNNRYVGEKVDFQLSGANGHLKIAPISLSMLGGGGAATIEGDFTGEKPVYDVHYELKRLQLRDLLSTITPKASGSGRLDFAADLTVRGTNAGDWTRTATGKATLTGQHLSLAIGDLDAKLDRLDKTQKFDLLDLGALLIAGPVGPVVTKGAEYASLAMEKGGSTQVETFSSRWKVENGVAHAEDVAMATEDNRVAMKGAIDFVHREFVDVRLAAIDGAGCARAEQKTNGPFQKPSIQKPSAAKALAGPFKHLAEKLKGQDASDCSVFYAGVVAPKS